METNNKISKQQSVSDLTTQTFKTTLSTAVVKAFARTGKECTQQSIELITSDIIDEYSELPIETIIDALKKGGRGKYGRTYLLSVQEICIWIDSYLKENPEDDIDNDKYDYYRKKDEYYLNIRRVLKGKLDINDDRLIAIDTTKLGNRNKQW